MKTFLLFSPIIKVDSFKIKYLLFSHESLIFWGAEYGKSFGCNSLLSEISHVE